MVDKAGMAVDTAGNAAHAARSRGRTVVDKADTEFRPHIDRNNRGHIPVPADHACLRQTNTKT
jgi:hypothetical protein